jgi:hypothetical protein
VLDAFQPGAPKRKRIGAAQPTAGSASERPRPRQYWCARCTTRVTDEDAAIEVGGAHRHRCVNPAGEPFELGCFAEAPGCISTGEPTDEFTWFPGYAWSFACCANCSAHLGWCYEGGGPRFYGLIFARLVGPI